MHIQQSHAPFAIAVEEMTQWVARPHQHNFFELVFIEAGTGQQCINYQHIAYKAGNVFLLPPLDCHSFQISTPTRFVFVRFTHQVFARNSPAEADFQAWFQQLSYILINYNQVPGDLIADPQDKHHLVQCLHLIRAEHTKGDTFSASLIQSTLVTVLNLLARHVEAALLAAPGSAPRRFVEVLNYIQHHLFQPEHLSIAALAARTGMASSYFGEYFRQHAGESLQAYITKSRLKVAESRLLHSDHSVKEIAFELGFTDTSHFARTFKKHYGYTAQQFKQRGQFCQLKSAGAPA
ncbi:AraC family transcriptional regulator [Hymenobacter fodinae]|uniref:AraC family transcriptional regulator n=1 Tax=Hymenobacter fodinae TaxID=2510796 RepID=A0A4Z0NYU4_9BACT|nr:AraC family transcriptional regulator [Hymenobacter fodinae]TGE03712.1 AraC family transcriptional regulator [Hymenobacter fodinae]